MQRIPARAFFFIAGSAALQVLCFPTSAPISEWRGALCWIALVPFFMGFLQRNQKDQPLGIRQSATLGYACGFLWYMGNCSWIYQTMYLYGGMEKPVACLVLVLFSLYLGLYHALFGGLFAIVNRSPWGSRGALLLSPFLWTAVELLRSRLTGFPWDLLGYTQVDNVVVTKLAPVGGVMAMSFLIAALNAAISLVFIRGARGRLLCRIVAGASAVLAIVLTLGGVSKVREQFRGEQSAVLVQENLSVGATARQERPLTLEGELSSFSDLSANPPALATSEGSRERPTVIIWPEAPSHLRSDDRYVMSSLAKLAERLQTPIIAGGLGIDMDNNIQRGYRLYDSALLFDGTGASIGRYDKVHLVPWGEYVPYKELFAFASKLTEGSSDMDAGRQRSIYRMAGHTYGVFICYESIFGDEVREFVKNGAEVLVNISDDGWYGDTGAPWQHLNMARMRAIENQRWLLRSTNTGESTVIDPTGRYVVTQRHIRTAFLLPFSFSHSLTFYTRHGDWFAELCAAVSVLALAWQILLRWSIPRPSTV